MSIFANGGFNAADAPDLPSDFQPFPAGVYTLRILEATETQSKAGNEMLKLALEVAEGEHENRRVWDYITPSNQYGLAKLKGLCLSAGLMTVTGTADLEGQLVRAKIKIEPPQNGYDASNKVTEYLAKPTVAASTSQAQPMPKRAGAVNSEWAG